MRGGILCLIVVMMLSLLVFGLTVERIEFRNKASRLGLGETVDMYLFDIYFDSKVYLVNQATKNIIPYNNFEFDWDIFNTSNPEGSIPICMGKSYYLCPRLPIGKLNN
eukprot:TRINITY_DN2419_c0_g1_i3.p1 TRINITY_DN2419_c0_g1~~TRINITY_DN2419_c0_g1_i3.p1  ORF type:complete len:108 (+),score=9.33 TRINITY_DN2419_c0_g1_i3:109-432(+)